MTPRILVFAGSIRSGAYSGKTADVAQKALAVEGADVTRVSLADYPLPIMDEDLQKEKGIPEPAMKLGRMIAGHDGVLVVTPEYNGTIPPLLSNAVAWLSRIRKDAGRPFKPLDGKATALCSSSAGPYSGVRAINHLRSVLVRCQMEVISPECSVANGGEAFGDDGAFVNERHAKAMQAVCRALVERARMLSTRSEP